MSDEPRMIRAGIQAARDRRTVPSFNDDIGDAIERDALAALDRLESQNQALQERAEKAERERDEARLAWTAANDRLAELTRVDRLRAAHPGD